MFTVFDIISQIKWVFVETVEMLNISHIWTKSSVWVNNFLVNSVRKMWEKICNNYYWEQNVIQNSSNGNEYFHKSIFINI